MSRTHVLTPRMITSLRIALAFTVLSLGSAAQAQTTIDFTPGFGSSTTPVVYQGVTFSTLNGSSFEANQDWSGYFANISGASLGTAFNDNTNQSAIRLTFPAPVTQVSLLLSTFPVTTWNVTAFDASNNQVALATVTSPNQSQAVRATVTGTGISYITVTEGSDNGNVTLMDDVTYTPAAATPEPGSIALFAGMSLTGAAVLRRRKAARKAGQ